MLFLPAYYPMNSRTPIVAANWKMNPAPQGWDNEDSPFHPREDIDVIVFPTLLDLPACIEAFMNTGAQAARPEQTGAFTGDISMHQLANHGCKYVLCGHSERRIHHAENDGFVALQVEAALAEGMTPILCIGETMDEREMGKAEETVKRQLEAVLNVVITQNMIIGYEPSWAIGTGTPATPADAQNIHAYIRSLLPSSIRETIRILYGASVKPDNAGALIAQPDIDGLLVGGASLKPESFGQIVDACASKA